MDQQQQDTTTQPTPVKKLRGFATMSKESMSQIASAGGRAAHAKGTAHQFTSEEAREAGRKGGSATARIRNGLKSLQEDMRIANAIASTKQ